MKTKTILRLLWCIAALFVSVSAFGQGTNAPTGIDATIASGVAKFSYWQTMLLPITLVIVMAVKKWVSFIPDKALPWVAPVIGGLLDMAAEKFGLWTGNPAIGAAMGGLATWAHQALIVQPGEPSETTTTPKVPVWLLIGALAFGACGQTGCSVFGTVERTPAAKKFDTYKLVFSGAEASYKQFKRNCFNGKVTAKNEAKGDQAWADFRVAYEAAFNAGMQDTAAPESFIALKNVLIRVISTL